MIYTCTMNPAIDMYVALKNLKPDTVNRTIDEDYQANGKGVNVSIMLKKLGIDSVALGFTAGFTGKYIEDTLNEMDISTDFVRTQGITRVNVFVNTTSEYKIVNQGPFIPVSDQESLLAKIKAIPAHSILIVSGSLPKGVPETIIVEIAKICHKRGIKLVLDTSVQAVMSTLEYEPYLLKPNEEEIANLFGVEKSLSEQELITNGNVLLRKGAKNVLISRGKDGALFLSNDKQCLRKTTTPQGKVVNTACAGDAMLAAFIGNQLKNYTLEESLIYATAVGASTAFSKGLSDLKDIQKLIQEVRIKKIEEEEA
ncbi:1-phosphofructokinase [Virgibacillus halodenitrificans]|uniref:Tagatose-6-phosphate kinase n=1 Tax=Virgibacillus halodenitrificans TaxID=1482 RepID=A0AAC9NM07_VIRHA|nr:1-phosphofructokinase [Virgibacillus halodenitrificans]APC49538.1 1-phosphofructokinase [Virgibacillus halodenitrificans]MYL45225.1 1-phosphofructokinase [Virgibacillus halodenitrificans]